MKWIGMLVLALAMFSTANSIQAQGLSGTTMVDVSFINRAPKVTALGFGIGRIFAPQQDQQQITSFHAGFALGASFYPNLQLVGLEFNTYLAFYMLSLRGELYTTTNFSDFVSAFSPQLGLSLMGYVQVYAGPQFIANPVIPYDGWDTRNWTLEVTVGIPIRKSGQ